MNLTGSESRNYRQTLAGALLLALVLSLLVWRSFRSVDLTDESFHAALTYRFLLGDVPFRDELTVHQMAALLTLPAVWLYDRVIGGPEALILFLRLLFVGFSALLGILIWRCLSRFIDPFGAALGAALFLLVYPARGLSYNSLGSGLVTASLCLAVLETVSPSRWRLPASGLAAGLAAIADPPLVLWLLFFAAQLWFMFPRNDRIRSVRLFVVGAAAALLPFAVLLLAIGPGHVIESIVRTNETANKLGDVRKLLGIGKYFVIQFPILPALLAIAAYRITRAKPQLSGIRAPAFLLALVASSLGFLDGGRLRPIGEWTDALVSLSLLAPVLIVLLNDATGARRAFFALWLGGAAAGLVAAYFTSNDPSNFAKFGRPCLLALMGAAWMVAQAESRSARRITRGLGWALGCLVVLFVLVTVAQSRRQVYRDRPLQELTYRIPKGPFAGIRTSQRRYELLSRLSEDLEASVPKTAYVIFFDDFPAGFLLSRRLPGTCGVWVFTQGDNYGFRNIYVDCTRAMARTPLYAIKLAVNPREALLPLLPPEGEDPFHRFVERCGSLVARREGLYDILRLDPGCNPESPRAGSRAQPSITLTAMGSRLSGTALSR
jgi:hypothetical protein